MTDIEWGEPPIRAGLMVLVPTRSRPQNVAPIVEAWYKTGAFGVAELCFIIDFDDPEYDRYIEEIGKHVQVQRAVIRDWVPMVPKLNRFAVQAAKTHEVVAFMGDDHLPRTPMWAHQLYKEGVLRHPSIVYGQDGYHDRKLPTWWSMSSDIIEALGCMVPSNVQHLFCDNVVMAMGERSETLVYLEGVLIEHMHPLAGKAKSDPQYVRVNRKEQSDRDQCAAVEWANYAMYTDINKIRALKSLPPLS